MATKTAEKTLLEMAEMAARYGLLANEPEIQEDAIVQHYAKLVATVMQLYKLIELYRYNQDGMPTQVREIITREVQKIKNLHAKDFGIDLTWKPIDNGR